MYLLGKQVDRNEGCNQCNQKPNKDIALALVGLPNGGRQCGTDGTDGKDGKDGKVALVATNLLDLLDTQGLILAVPAELQGVLPVGMDNGLCLSHVFCVFLRLFCFGLRWQGYRGVTLPRFSHVEQGPHEGWNTLMVLRTRIWWKNSSTSS